MQKMIYLNQSFFGYEKEIIKEMKKRFETYELRKDLNVVEKYFTILLKLFLSKEIGNKVIDKIICKKLEKQIKKLNSEFDYTLFCIADYHLSNNQLNLIKRKLKIKSSILYLWDDMERVLKWESEKKPYKFLKYKNEFNRIYSFDESDCKKFDFIYRPTFYSKNLEKINNIKLNINFDYMFVGQYSRERYLKIQKISKILKGRHYIYFCDRIDNFFKLYLKIKNIHFRKLAKSEYNKKMLESNIIIDLVNSRQKGVTQRTLDSIYLEKKIITDLKEVEKYDFYNKNNIFIIKDFNSINKKKIQNFLISDYISIDKKIVENYSIENWMNSFEFNKRY